MASHEATVPGDLTAVLRQRGAELGVPLSSVLLAAHARVIGALSGEPDIVTGYLATPHGRPLPCRLAADASSWRALLRDTHRCEWELLSHRDFPVNELRGELGLAGPSFETVFDPADEDGKLAGEVVLQVGISPDRSRSCCG